jgi:hypothetical protein
MRHETLSESDTKSSDESHSHTNEIKNSLPQKIKSVFISLIFSIIFIDVMFDPILKILYYYISNFTWLIFALLVFLMLYIFQNKHLMSKVSTRLNKFSPFIFGILLFLSFKLISNVYIYYILANAIESKMLHIIEKDLNAYKNSFKSFSQISYTQANSADSYTQLMRNSSKIIDKNILSLFKAESGRLVSANNSVAFSIDRKVNDSNISLIIIFDESKSGNCHGFFLTSSIKTILFPEKLIYYYPQNISGKNIWISKQSCK